MKLALISHGPPGDPRQFSGIPWHVLQELRRQGHEVAPFYAPPASWAKKLSQWQNLFSLKFHRQPHNPEADPWVLRTRSANVAGQIRNFAPEAVLCVGFPEAAIAVPKDIPLYVWMDALYPSLRRLYPYYRVYYGEGDARRLQAIENQVLERCVKIWLSSDWAADESRADFPAAAKNIRVQSFGANLVAVPAGSEVEGFFEHRNLAEPVFLFLAQEWERKGGDTAVETIRRLRERGTAARLVIIGPKNLQPDLSKNSWIEQVGVLDKSQPEQAQRLSRHFAEAAFLLLPSVADCTPIVCHEAAAFGVPVLATNVGGLPSTVDSGETGMLWPIDKFATDAPAWMAAMLANRTRYEAMARTARRRYETRGNWAVNVRAVTATMAAGAN